MRPVKVHRVVAVAFLASALTLHARAAAPAGEETAAPTSTVIRFLDLRQAFGTRSDWSFSASQEPPIPDPFGWTGDEVPGRISLCLAKASDSRCDARLQERLFDTSDIGLFSERHYLKTAEIVYPHGAAGRPLLLVAVASLHSGDGDQTVLTQALAYRVAIDGFTVVYQHSVARNNNQETRYIASGRLHGDIISVEPASTAPFGYWVSVDRLAWQSGYRRILRFRSATTYDDGNPLPVIDSEMANIQRRLGVWHHGLPLPLPDTSCPRAHLVHLELWCQ